jgi:peptide-methionine (S)-S-oxide reductase
LWLGAGNFVKQADDRQDYLERIPNGYTCHFVRPGRKLPVRDKAKVGAAKAI